MLKDLHCRMELAIKYGADAAIFLNNIVYWISPHEVEKRHFYEGRYWMNASIQGFSKLYPLWSVPQLKRMISRLRDDGALLVGDFNEDRMDRTRWYSVNDEIMALYTVDESYFTMVRNRSMHGTDSSDVGTKSSHVYNEEGEYKEFPLPPKGDGVRKRRKRDKSVPDWKPERFEAFWTYYRTHARGEDRQGAVRAWDKLQPGDELIAAMGKTLQAQVQSEEWQRGIGIPYAKTWLNNARWRDQPKAPPGLESGEEGRRYGWQ